MYSQILCVIETISTKHKPDKWPIKILRWLIKKAPNKWVGHGSEIMHGETTINCLFPAVKYLVENRGWSFSEACIAASRLCERCMNICLWECEGHDLATEKHYLQTTRTQCQYCDYIDPGYLNRYRMWCCYRTFKYGGDVALAYRETRVDALDYLR